VFVDFDFDDARSLFFHRLFVLATRSADEVEVVLFGLLLLDIQTFAVLPDVAPLAGHAMGAVVDLAVKPTDAVENPVVLFLFNLFQSLLGLLDLDQPTSL
jgi:hypothetical protein